MPPGLEHKTLAAELQTKITFRNHQNLPQRYSEDLQMHNVMLTLKKKLVTYEKVQVKEFAKYNKTTKQTLTQLITDGSRCMEGYAAGQMDERMEKIFIINTGVIYTYWLTCVVH